MSTTMLTKETVERNGTSLTQQASPSARPLLLPLIFFAASSRPIILPMLTAVTMSSSSTQRMPSSPARS